MKKILYFDMDNVLVDFPSALHHYSAELREKYDGHDDDIPGIFSKMKPLPGAIDAFNTLCKCYDSYKDIAEFVAAIGAKAPSLDSENYAK